MRELKHRQREGRREVEERDKKIRTRNKEDHQTVFIPFFFKKKKMKNEKMRELGRKGVGPWVGERIDQ
jgi:hypothetical protein